MTFFLASGKKIRLNRQFVRFHPACRFEPAATLQKDKRYFRRRAGVRFSQRKISGRAAKKNMTETIDKEKIISEYKTHDGDTGSAEVQIAILTHRVSHLTDHLRTHRKDYHSRRGLLMMTSRRRKLLDYLKRTDLERYNNINQRLKIRR